MSVILGIIAFIVIFVILRAKCCPYWSPIESIADFITDCKKCEGCSKKDPEIQFVATPVEKKPKTRRKNTWAPVKKHMGTLRLAMHTPKPGTSISPLSMDYRGIIIVRGRSMLHLVDFYGYSYNYPRIYVIRNINKLMNDLVSQCNKLVIPDE